MDDRKMALAIVAGFAAMTLYLAFKADDVALAMKSMGTAQALFTYYVLNPSYWFLVLGTVRLRAANSSWFGAFVGGLLIVIATDTSGLPHCVPKAGLPVDVTAYGCADTTYMQLFTNQGMSFNMAYILYYAVFPIALFVLALYLMGYKPFVKKVAN